MDKYCVQSSFISHLTINSCYWNSMNCYTTPKLQCISCENSKPLSHCYLIIYIYFLEFIYSNVSRVKAGWIVGKSIQINFKLSMDFEFYKYKLQNRFLNISRFSLEHAATGSVVSNETLSWTKPGLEKNRPFPKSLCNLPSIG